MLIDAVKMALDVNQLRAQVASMNIVNAGSVGATHFTIDDTQVNTFLASVAEHGGEVQPPLEMPNAVVSEQYGAVRPTLDELVSDSVTAGLEYQALSESLGRHFALLRLAMTGRSS
ncbi:MULTISPECIES: hypothetical protein [Pseudoxanthomonas]|nr:MULTISPECIES: hypothetical protein [Pseudoxanthomonas]